MCRLYGFRANELTKVECTLVHAQNALLVQSKSDQTGRSHADGWGIACYSDIASKVCLPELIRHKTAAFDTTHFSHQAESVYAKTVLAHVRLATVGYVGTLNSHPFNYDEWTFAHNGTIPEFDQLKDQLERESGKFQDTRCGATDSEQLFLWLLERLKKGGVDLQKPRVDDVNELLVEAVAELDSRVNQISKSPAKLTFIMSNGRLVFACRFNNPLYRLVRRGVHDCEICGIPHIRHDESIDYRAVLFASEPITSEPWEEVPNYSLFSVDEELCVASREVATRANS